MFRLRSLLVILLSYRAYAAVLTANDTTCSCGFYDADTQELFTESIIVYFNETDALPPDFVAEDYQRKYEKDWNAIYRQGADPSNLQFEDAELRFFVSPPDSTHLVTGGVIRTRRRDIQHGSFRALMQSPDSNATGSAFSMIWQYNETEVAELSVMNTDDPTKAWVGTFINDEFATRDHGVNYSQAINSTTSNRNYTVLDGALSNGSVDPWLYTEYRIDWTKDYINFYEGGNASRHVVRDKDPGMPSVPAPFYFKHWATGNQYSMGGPPTQRSGASLKWVRMFFNSSYMTDDMRQDFVKRCPLTLACLTNDPSLRGSTPYSDDSTRKWEQKDPNEAKRMPALWISIVCIGFSSLLLLHAFIRRAPWRRRSKPQSHIESSSSASGSIQDPRISPFEPDGHSFALRDSTGTQTSSSLASRPSSIYDSQDSRDDLAIEKAEPRIASSVFGDSSHSGGSQSGSLRFDSRGTTPCVLSPYSSCYNITMDNFQIPEEDQARTKTFSQNTLTVEPVTAIIEPKIPMETVTESALPAPRMTAHPPPPRERIDHLAGIVALCAILVTVMHFGLTFVPAIVIPGAPVHYQSEYWAQKIVAPFVLNQMWLGVFFTTSVRFLVANYLKDGNLKHIAKAAVRRTPRLMIPIAAIALLEYFFIDVGFTKYLQYLPSITWSTWPYVARFPTVGHFISEVLELVYLIPNAVPQITFNYCTGVLWTIAVQLQGSWLVLVGVIVVREISTPWKRFAYYAFCIVNHWYAQSWGSYLWVGLLLADLDVTYKYKPYLYARPTVYYPLVTFCWLAVAAGFSANILPNWNPSLNFPVVENNIHPDPNTGDALANTNRAGYPAYYIPRFNGFLFACGMQAIVELSPCVQYILSLPLFLVIFPHIFTIYLLHGLVFWSWGSWLMVLLADRDFSYGLNVAIVGVTSYAVLGLTLPIVTPLVEALGKDITGLVWMSATERPPPRRRTLFPFPEDLFKRRDAKSLTPGDVEARAHCNVREESKSTLATTGTSSSKGKSVTFAMKDISEC